MQGMSETEKRIRHVLNTSLSLELSEEELIQAVNLDELFGVDSLAILEFVTALEKEFGIRLDPEHLEMDLLKNLPRLSSYVESRLQGIGRECVRRNATADE